MLRHPSTALYPVVCAGIDWLTCTAKNGSPALALERVADEEVASNRRSGVSPTSQSWLGFEGYKLEGLFFGRREHDVMLCLSGPLSNDLASPAIAASSNVSRMDLQVTIYTEGEERTLAQDTWTHLKSVPKGEGRPRSFSMIVGHPAGQTFYLNARSSDNFGRIYDKGVESKMGPAGLLWRYEVEFKRKVAKHESGNLPPQDQLCSYVTDRVHRWMTERNAQPPFTPSESYAAVGNRLLALDTDVLTWFRKSLRVTIANQVKKHGLAVVLESLGLLGEFQSHGGKFDGDLAKTRTLVSSGTGLAVAQPDHPERLLVH